MSEERDRFQKRVEALVETVRQWVEPHEWVTKPYPKKIRDVDRQVFEVPALFLQKGPTRVLLDPVAYDVPGAEGLVDLYLMPTYDDKASLYFEGGGWVIHYPFACDFNGDIFRMTIARHVSHGHLSITVKNRSDHTDRRLDAMLSRLRAAQMPKCLDNADRAMATHAEVTDVVKEDDAGDTA